MTFNFPIYSIWSPVPQTPIVMGSYGVPPLPHRIRPVVLIPCLGVSCTSKHVGNLLRMQNMHNIAYKHAKKNMRASVFYIGLNAMQVSM
jgi:hypothetical protein